MLTSFIDKVNSNTFINKTIILKALTFATQAHKGQTRSSGHDYIVHPVAVASLVFDYAADAPSIAAALLHDVVEDTPITLADINAEFGGEIATLVEGVTKLSKISFRDDATAKAENLRKFILSISKDFRILLIKLADRLHNLRTLKFITNPEKQKAIALETLEIYVPLAERIGLISIKDELEDLSFEFVNPFVRSEIISTLENYKNSINIDLTQIEKELQQLLNRSGIKNYFLQGRIKRPYSIWSKMRKNAIDFTDIDDLVAFRIVVNKVAECYQVLGIVHSAYKSFFPSFRDYISVEKENGYRSIHTCILFKPGLKVEIQIRTKEMHKIAENGLAAHWNYKNKVKPYDMREYLWLNNLLEIVSSPFLGTKEKYEYSKLEMFDSEIFVFTPKGKLVSLPKGSIVLDFAYAIHTDIGNTCVGATINGEFSPAFAELENGTTVKVITSPDKEPNMNHINIVKTGYAISCIRRYWRNKKKEKIETIIENILKDAFKNEGLEYHAEVIPQILEKYSLITTEFYWSLLHGYISIDEVIKTLYPKHTLKSERISKLFELPEGHNANAVVYLADCCLPVKGDKLKGVLSLDQSIKAHREDCCDSSCSGSTPNNLKLIDINWANNINHDEIFTAKIALESIHKPGTLFTIFQIFSKRTINITDVAISPYSNNIKIITITCEVGSLEILNALMSELESLDIIKEVRRCN